MKRYFFLVLMLLLPFRLEAAVVGQTVEYQDGDTPLEGYLVYDNALKTKRPAVLVVHEYRGLNDYAKKRATQLAGLGYVAFAVDMYGKGVHPQTHEEAAKLAGVYQQDRELMRRRIRAAYKLVKNYENVDKKRIAAIGYCFGGTTVLEMARAGFDMKGVVSFHGALDTPVPAKKGSIKGRVLVMHGALDPFVTQDQVTVFQKEMMDSGADWQLTQFGGAVHSFTVSSAGTDISKGAAYNKEADHRSWKMLQLFFKEIF